jgi:hypothetical protein
MRAQKLKKIADGYNGKTVDLCNGGVKNLPVSFMDIL